jgi:prepilin-type N-terminal cleavage/methylation domain-containing protein
MNKQAGFNLTELLLVLAIIGILAGIAIPFILGRRDIARQKSTVAMAHSVASECDAAAKAMAGSTPTAVISYVRALSNFTYPRCKNAYSSAITAVIAGTATNDGEVGLLAGTQNDSNGSSVKVIVVSYKHSGLAGPLIVANVPVE